MYQQDWENELALLKYKTNADPDPIDISFGLIPENTGILSKWDIWALNDPDEIEPYSIFNRKYGRLLYGKKFLHKMGYPQEFWTDDEFMVPDDKVAVVFDLTLSINAQYEKARKLLENIKKQSDIRVVLIIEN